MRRANCVDLRGSFPLEDLWCVCPICLCCYSRLAGTQCGDLSRGQVKNCVGRLIPVAEFLRAEWRTEPNDDPELQRALDARREGCR